MQKPPLTIDILREQASAFARMQPLSAEPLLYGVTDGKAIGTLLEQRFHSHLSEKYHHLRGSSSRGRDLPGVNVDLKTTSMRQPQSSCPYRSATQKIYGLGYSLLIFVYDKTDDDENEVGRLDIVSSVFVDQSRTADFQTTIGLRDLIDHNATEEDIVAFLENRKLPVDASEARRLAKRILASPPAIGYLTISNALQWRLQYGRVVDQAGTVDGVVDLMSPVVDSGDAAIES